MRRHTGRCSFLLHPAYPKLTAGFAVRPSKLSPRGQLTVTAGAAEHKGDEVIATVRHVVGRFVDDLAITPNAIARHVGADVEVKSKRGNAEITDIGHADDRARFGIELAEAVKGVGVLLMR